MSESNDIEKKVRDLLQDDLPPEVESQMRQSLSVFQCNLSNHPYFKKQSRPSFRLFPWMPEWNWAWAGGVALLVIGFCSMLFMANEKPTWADVVRQFQSLSFFHATVYIKGNPFATPTQYELWLGRQGKIRMLFGHQVLFAERGKVLKTYNVLSRQESEPSPEALHLIEMLESVETFSLETLIQTIAGKMEDLQPVPGTVDAVASDLSVFDLGPFASGEWVRIWTLQESQLPIQLKKSDPRGGESIDALFEYLDQQPDKFFDAEEFAHLLADSSQDTLSLIYANLRDPSNRPISPQDLSRPESVGDKELRTR